MERKQIQFTRRQLTAVRREARRRHVSESAIVREAVDRWIGVKSDTDRHARFERALSAVGAFRSGRRDIAREHDRELAAISYEHTRRKR